MPTMPSVTEPLKRSAVILDPGLYLEVGHHLGYDVCVRTAFIESGYRSHVYCNRAAQHPWVLAQATPHFTYNLYESLSQHGLRSRLNLHHAELSTVINHHPIPGSLFFMPNAGLLDLMTFSRFADLLRDDANFVFLLRFQAVDSLFLEPLDSTHEFVSAARYLIHNHKNIRFLTDTIELQNYWRGYGIETELVPIPLSPDLKLRSVDDPNVQYIFTSLGQTNKFKGIAQIIGAFEILDANGVRLNSFIQTTFHDVPAELKAKLSFVNFNNTPLTYEQYTETLARSLIYLNIYDPSRFTTQSSNALPEAIISGCIPICTDFPFARSLIGPDADLFLVDYTVEAVVHKMIVTLQRHLENPAFFSERLDPVAKRLRFEHSPSSLIQKLLEPPQM